MRLVAMTGILIEGIADGIKETIHTSLQLCEIYTPTVKLFI